MARDYRLLELRAKRIHTYYNKYRQEKINGQPKYTYEAILEKISEKVFVAPRTVNNILNNWAK